MAARNIQYAHHRLDGSEARENCTGATDYGGAVVRHHIVEFTIRVGFAPVKVDGQLLVDGVLVKNVPVDVARAMGVDLELPSAAEPNL